MFILEAQNSCAETKPSLCVTVKSNLGRKPSFLLMEKAFLFLNSVSAISLCAHPRFFFLLEETEVLRAYASSWLVGPGLLV